MNVKMSDEWITKLNSSKDRSLNYTYIIFSMSISIFLYLVLCICLMDSKDSLNYSAELKRDPFLVFNRPLFRTSESQINHTTS